MSLGEACTAVNSCDAFPCLQRIYQDLVPKLVHLALFFSRRQVRTSPISLFYDIVRAKVERGRDKHRARQ
jgi:hypothetical protein